MSVAGDKLIDMYRKMVRIRVLEERSPLQSPRRGLATLERANKEGLRPTHANFLCTKSWEVLDTG